MTNISADIVTIIMKVFQQKIIINVQKKTSLFWGLSCLLFFRTTATLPAYRFFFRPCFSIYDPLFFIMSHCIMMFGSNFFFFYRVTTSTHSWMINSAICIITNMSAFVADSIIFINWFLLSCLFFDPYLFIMTYRIMVDCFRDRNRILMFMVFLFILRFLCLFWTLLL